VAQVARLRLAVVVPKRRLMHKAAAAGDRRAAQVLAVTAYLHPSRSQNVKGEGSNTTDRLGDVPLAGIGCPHPVTNLEAGHVPVDAVQAAAADERPRPFEEEQEPEVFPRQEARPALTQPRFTIGFGRWDTLRPGHPFLQLRPGLVQSAA